MKPSLQFRLSQHLTLTPQLQQSIRLLQLSTVELNQEMERLRMENPALEREDIDDGEAPVAPPGAAASPAAEGSDAQEQPASHESDAHEHDWSGDGAAPYRGSEEEEGGERNFTPSDTP